MSSASLISFDRENLGDEIFMHAAARFAHLAQKEEITQNNQVKYTKSSTSVTSQNNSENRCALSLAFACLRYQSSLEELLLESGFFDSAPLPDDLNSLVMVMLWDFSQRKFVKRGTRSKSKLGDRIEEVEEVELNLEKFAVKLAASLARMRIREAALTLGDTLSPDLKNQERIRQSVPIYGWINLNYGINEIDHIPAQLAAMNIDFDFCTGLKEGLIKFDSEFLNALEASDLVQSGKILIVDSTASIGTTAVVNLLNGEETNDILQGGGTLSSIPALADRVHRAGNKMAQEAEREKYLYGGDEVINIRKPKLLICLLTKRHKAYKAYLEKIKVPTQIIEFLPPLSTMEPSDSRLSHVKICLIEPRCSLSAAADPLHFLLMEGLEDDDRRLSSLASGNPIAQEGLKTVLAASLLLPRSAATVYITRSKLPKENEEIVQYALKSAPPKSGFKLSPIPLKLPIYIAENTYGNYLRINSSETGSGLFLCTITRDILDPKDFLKKQALKGLIIPRKSAPKQLITPQESVSKINNPASSTKMRKTGKMR